MLADVGRDRLAHLLHRLPAADTLREFVVDVRFFLNANFLQRHFVVNALSAKLFVRGILTVGLVERSALAGLLAAEGIMQLRHRSFFAHPEMPGARFALQAFTAGRDVDHREVIVLQKAIVFDTIRARLVAEAFDHLVDIFIGDFDLGLVDLYAAIFAKLDPRFDLEFRLVLDRRALDERIDVLQLRIADRLDAFFGDRIAEAARQQPVHDFVLDLLREPRADDAGRHLAGTKAGQLRLAREFGGHTLRLVGDQISGDLDFNGFLDGA